MKIKSVLDPAFRPYGEVVQGYDFTPLLDALAENTAITGEVVYEPSLPALENLAIFKELEERLYGGMPIEIGYCNGNNVKLNCYEYHRDCEIDIAGTDAVLLVAPLQKVVNGTLDTSVTEAFLLPRGTAALLYETTLHYAPCNAPGAPGFRTAVILPRGTNADLLQRPEVTGAAFSEDQLLWARNKWLIAHPDAPEAAQGAFVGLTGENISLDA